MSEKPRFRSRPHRAVVCLFVLSTCLCVGVTLPALAAPFAFVANRGSDDVTVVDTWTHAVVATLPTANRPRALVTSPDGATLYVACEDVVTQIDLRTLDRRDIPYSGALTDGLAIVIHPDGSTLWVSHKNASFLSKIDIATGGATGIGIPGSDVDHLAIDENGDWIVGVTGGGDVFQLDPATDQSVRLFMGAYSFPTGLAFDLFGDVLIASDANLSVEAFGLSGFGQVGSPSVEASGFRPGGLSAAVTPVVTLPFDDAVLYTSGGTRVQLPAGAEPVDVADSWETPFQVTANAGDVTGQAAPGHGSISFLTSGGVAASVPAGDRPEAVVIAAIRGEEVMAFPADLRFNSLGSGGVARQDVDVVSVGDESAFIWDVRVSGPDAAAFRIVRDDCSRRGLDYQQACRVGVEFTAIPKPVPWWARFLKLYVPTYSADLLVDSGPEQPLRIPLRAGLYLDDLGKAELAVDPAFETSTFSFVER